MQAAAKHVTYQLTNEYSQVGYLLGAIHFSDAILQATMSSVKTYQAINGRRIFLKLILPICFHTNRCRRRELIMQEASVTLLISQT